MTTPDTDSGLMERKAAAYGLVLTDTVDFTVAQVLRMNETTDAATALIQSLEAQVAKLSEALEPVLHWYQSDEHDERPLIDIVRDVVADLQADRKALLANTTDQSAQSDAVGKP